MRVLLGLAAFAAILSSSPAQSISASGYVAPPDTDSASTGFQHHRRDRDSRFHGRVHRGFPAAVYGYAGYVDSGDFDSNRGFDPDKWNDWWHDRPDRAYPRWMSRNQDCARRWYSGDVLTC
jgi:hypothetical protein